MIGRKLMEIERNGNSSGLRKQGAYANWKTPRRRGTGITAMMTKNLCL
jgi:hypothetical protein